VVSAVTYQGHVTAELMGACSVRGKIGDEIVEFDGDPEAEHVAVEQVFQDAVAAGDMTGIRSPFADALKTFEAAAKVNEALYGSTRELD
jgi:hypothetical protein